MIRRILYGLCIGTIAITVACGKSETPVAPTQTNVASGAAAPDGSTLKIDAPTLNSPADGFEGGLGNATPLILTVNNVKGKYSNFQVTYEFELKNTAGAVVYTSFVVENAAQGTTQRTIDSTVVSPQTNYTWRARATYNGAVGPWSTSRSFKTAVPAGCFGQTIFDPLTNGTTCGKIRGAGGQFVPGQGWQSLHLNDVIDYDIPTCTSCTLEFDITNIGPQEGECCFADLKFISMGDATSMNDFGAFRDNPWKMHFIQRADFPTGLEMVWRNGGTDADGGNPGDHRIKSNDGGPTFRASSVGHWIIVWDKDGYTVSNSTDGGPTTTYLTCGELTRAADCQDGHANDIGFNGRPYAPPNHRIELGCFPRNESFIGAIYRNIKLTPNK